MRDPALAALVGAIPGDDFGGESSSFGADEFTAGAFGAEFGDDYGVDFGADVAPPAPPLPAGASIPRPTAPAMMALWNQHHAMRAHTARRESLLEPNKNSTLKIEKYSFVLNQVLTIGTLATINMSGAPDFKIRPIRVTMNAPSAQFVLVSEIKVANVSATSGASDDAINYAATAVDQQLSLPTLSPQNKVTVLGQYTGFAPPPFVAPMTYTFSVGFKGWSSMVA